MLQIKWTDRIKNEVFQRGKEERLILNFFLKIDATHGKGT
jgi:hypothetical protein